MKQRLLVALGLLVGPALCGAALVGATGGGTDEFQFERPVRLMADGVPIRVESPGYAFPCLADVDGDGKPDLLVGQFNQGKIQVFKGLGGSKFAKGTWLQADGKAAEVPGVW